MRSQTPHSDGIGSQTTLYDVILVTLPLPFVVGVLLGRVTTLPTSLVVGVCGLVSIAVLAYGLFVAPPTTPLASKQPVSKQPVSPLDGVEANAPKQAAENQRRGSI